jgi:hypothetical protein
MRPNNIPFCPIPWHANSSLKKGRQAPGKPLQRKLGELKGGVGAAGGLSPVVRGVRAGCQRAAVAPKVASSPRGSGRRPPCGQPGSIPAAGLAVKKKRLPCKQKGKRTGPCLWAQKPSKCKGTIKRHAP